MLPQMFLFLPWLILNVVCTIVVQGAFMSGSYISTFAGGADISTVSDNGDGGPATSAVIYNPKQCWVDTNDAYLYVAEQDGNRIRRVDLSTFIITRIAGAANGAQSSSGDGVAAISAELNKPRGLVGNTAGELFVSEWKGHKVRMVDLSSGIITSYAGDGTVGVFSSDPMPALSIQLNGPNALTVDSNGNVYIADSGNYRVVRVYHNEPDRKTELFAGNGNAETKDDSVAIKGALNIPEGLYYTAETLYITEWEGHVIRQVNSQGELSTIGGIPNNPSINSTASNGDSGPMSSATFNSPQGLWVDSTNTVGYIADYNNNKIRGIDGSIIYTVAGTGESGYDSATAEATGTKLDMPSSIVGNSDGSVLYVSDSGNNVIRILTEFGPSPRPTLEPTSQPSIDPSSQPTSQPSVMPSSQPSVRPSKKPTCQPSSLPSSQPSIVPSVFPSMQPSTQPSAQPSPVPSTLPSTQPSSQPSATPSAVPSVQPSIVPSAVPSAQPSSQPSTAPSAQPSSLPTSSPSKQPSSQPSSKPSTQPSVQPSVNPTTQPTIQPSSRPSDQPSTQPSSSPTSSPSMQPSSQPSSKPSTQPSSQPSSRPSFQPTTSPSIQPSVQPSNAPSTSPSTQPSSQPSSRPSDQPSTQPSSSPTVQPSAQPSVQPSDIPSTQPSIQPSAIPTTQPTSQPSVRPSSQPSSQPTVTPSVQPSAQPSVQPSDMPSTQPSIQPSAIPTTQPTSQPSVRPSSQPSTQPSSSPTVQPSAQPSVQPSEMPSTQPSIQPSAIPTTQPTIQPSSRPSDQPSTQPSSAPTVQPSIQPSVQPSGKPSTQPSAQPSVNPTTQPTIQPSSRPSDQPSTQPTSSPTVQPSTQPSVQPSGMPSTQPSIQPSAIPTTEPAVRPTSRPSIQPSTQPSSYPTTQPSIRPSGQPSGAPSCQPSSQPSAIPSMQPTDQPSSRPSSQPSVQPSSFPSIQPTSQPTAQPSIQPSTQPSAQPSSKPSFQPSARPSLQPTTQPTCQPTIVPSTQPTAQPSIWPSAQPSVQPSAQPSMQPSSGPSQQPTGQPSSTPSSQPSSTPSVQPTTQPSAAPSTQPSVQPSAQPSTQPSVEPTQQPSVQPTSQPTVQPSNVPAVRPTSAPSMQPSSSPSRQPTVQPSILPTNQPSGQPSLQPSVHPSTQPSTQPTAQPTQQPSSMPSTQPSFQPSAVPTTQPSTVPSCIPTSQPSHQPTRQPSEQPSTVPSSQPSRLPSMQPSSQPTAIPSMQPSRQPTAQPSGCPSSQPSRRPSEQPSSSPSKQPTRQPTKQPSRAPTGQPSGQPSRHPSMQPTVTPSRQPSFQPSRQPTRQPSSRPSQQPSRSPSKQPSKQPSMQPSRSPSVQPSSQPTRQPSRAPTMQPSRAPSKQPSKQPTRQPTQRPSAQPSRLPSRQPSMQPSASPSSLPSRQPSQQPTRMPTQRPSASPSTQPTTQPSLQPFHEPSSQPTTMPSFQPVKAPSRQPTSRPTRGPTTRPSGLPSSVPSKQPIVVPSMQPTGQPVMRPSAQPSRLPTSQPSASPTEQPTTQPICAPTGQPSSFPSRNPTIQPTCAPSGQPSDLPSGAPTQQPSVQPSRVPSRQPSALPTMQPSVQPSKQPSVQPSRAPASHPSRQPSRQPSKQPTLQPKGVPTGQPSTQPSLQPLAFPSSSPTVQPSRQPTKAPSSQPIRSPTVQPSRQPTKSPTTQPTRKPTVQPSSQPTSIPSRQPSRRPTSQPTIQPSRQPSRSPSQRPTTQPTSQPSTVPTATPTRQPSTQPSRQPSRQPTKQPTDQPSRIPTTRPTSHPSQQPSIQPSRIPSMQPSMQPSRSPSSQPSRQPSRAPSQQPSVSPSSQPTSQPVREPTMQPTRQPTSSPTRQPTAQPSEVPSIQPSAQPTKQPSIQPSSSPSKQPTKQPSSRPSMQPTTQPTRQPTCQPSTQPSKQPTVAPSRQPTRIPTVQPSCQPLSTPSLQPSRQPTFKPSVQPSMCPSSQPSSSPTNQPSIQPSVQPSSCPSIRPSTQPSVQPSAQPSALPSVQPSAQPSTQPTTFPTGQPSSRPSVQPSCQPTVKPSTQPTCQPSSSPSIHPSTQPSSQPSIEPSSVPTGRPSVQPSRQPSLQPSREPTAQPSTVPSAQPTVCPSNQPSSQPSTHPSAQPLQRPTMQPSAQPSVQPTEAPSSQPLSRPTVQPSGVPSAQPSALPSTQPSRAPSTEPSSAPSPQPSVQPSSHPSMQPSDAPSAQPTEAPTSQPSTMPTKQPLSRPTVQPSGVPSAQPSALPSTQPSRQPSAEPSSAPSPQPSVQPSAHPSMQPSDAPSAQPTEAPSSQPSTMPTRQPSLLPSTQPESEPSAQPSDRPSCQPSSRPSVEPSGQPSITPSMQPSDHPSGEPSSQPTLWPTSQPVSVPSSQPSSWPTSNPSQQPIDRPTLQPSNVPSVQPSVIPTGEPTMQPTVFPSGWPSCQPSSNPSAQPFQEPSGQPSCTPSVHPSQQPFAPPTSSPSVQPSTVPSGTPSCSPSSFPTIVPNIQPTSQPSASPAAEPSVQPSLQPRAQPTTLPSLRPSGQPSVLPSSQPTVQPSVQPSTVPSSLPTIKPSMQPTSLPSMRPSRLPTLMPSSQPSAEPSLQPVGRPSAQPFALPSTAPSSIPSSQPNVQPTSSPSMRPTVQPLSSPSAQPSLEPSTIPTATPSVQPTAQPSSTPSVQPSSSPSIQPTVLPSTQPSRSPSSSPTNHPTAQPWSNPSSQPTRHPSTEPSEQPSCQPTKQPSTCPSAQPSSLPSAQPFVSPSMQPSIQPSASPSVQPSSQPSTSPSIQPSAIPSRQPTSQPTVRPSSSRPSSEPSSRPSKRPASSVPTLPGQTLPPSEQPTSSPTYDMNYADVSTYKEYLRVQASEYVADDIYSFGMYNFKGLNVDGSCSGWTSYMQSALNLPFQGVYFSEMTSFFNHFDYDVNGQGSGLAGYSRANDTCRDRRIIAQVASSLLRGVDYDGNCDGVSWRVFTCNGQRVFCTNCKRSCVASETCPGISGANVFNPCGSYCPQQHHAAAGALIKFKFAEDILYPLISAPIVARGVSANSIVATVNITKAGRVSCAALLPHRLVSGVADIDSETLVKGSAFTALESGGVLNVTMKALSPLTTYNVYCYTDDLLSHEMPFTVAASFASTASTLCCRNILLQTSSDNIVQYIGCSQKDFVYLLGLDSYPERTTTVTLNLTMVQCAGTNNVIPFESTEGALLPTTLTYSPNTTSSLTQSFIIRHFVTGCYVFDAYIASAMDGTPYTPVSMSVTIRNIKIAPSAPTLSQALFSDEGSNILINFQANTDKGAMVLSSTFAAFSCDVLFAFRGSNLTSCLWVTPKQVSVSAVSTSVFPFVGDTVSVRSGTVKAECETTATLSACQAYAFNTVSSVALQAPTNPVRPLASLFAANRIGACDDLILDPTATVGHLGKEWRSVRWAVYVSTVSTTVPVNLTAVAQLDSFLNKYATDVAHTVDLPNSLLVDCMGDTFSIYMELTNYMGDTSVAKTSTVLEVFGSPVIPQVFLYGSKVAFYRWKTLTFLAVAEFPTCALGVGGAITNQQQLIPLTYTWKVYRGLKYMPSLQSSSKDPRTMILPPYSLNSSTEYTVQCVVTVVNTSSSSSSLVVFSTASSTFTVARSGVVAVITGGTQQMIDLSSAAILDASGSYSLDDSSNTVVTASGGASTTTTSTALKYSWSCTALGSNFGIACLNFGSPTEAVLQIPANSLANGLYAFNVTVMDNFGAFSTAESIVTITASQIPTISLAAPATKYNPNDKIVLSGTVVSSIPTTDLSSNISSNSGVSLALEWSLLDYSSDFLLSVASSPRTSSYSISGKFTAQLALRPYRLEGGLSYTFRLSARYVGVGGTTTGASSVASIVVRMNKPPQNGVALVSPSDGIVLNTRFALSTAYWTDETEDFPLTYVFGYYTTSADRMRLNVVKQDNQLAYATSYLSQGLASSDYVVTCVVVAYDSYRGASNVTTTVRVRPAAQTTSLIANTGSALASAITLGDGALAAQAVGAAAVAVSTVDCAVNIPCVDLNRAECTSSVRTCGQCLDGYIGISGHSNVACSRSSSLEAAGTRHAYFYSPLSPSSSSSASFSSSSSSAVSSSSSLVVNSSLLLKISASVDTVLPIGASCSYDDQCITGDCAENECRDVLKPCSGNCGDGFDGVCTYQTILGVPLEKCYTMDSSCIAVCACFAGNYGSDCSLTLTKLNELVSFREELCSSLYTTRTLRDVTTEQFRSNAVSIFNILSDASQISQAALELCTLALVDEITSSPDLTCMDGSLTTFEAVNAAFSRILKVGGYVGSSTGLLSRFSVDSISSSLSTLLSSCVGSLVAGEEPLYMSSDTLRMASSMFSLATDVDSELPSTSGGGSYGYGLSLPLNSYEEFVGALRNSLTLTRSGVSSSSTVGVSLIQLRSNPYGINSNATDLQTRLTVYEESVSSSLSRATALQRVPSTTAKLADDVSAIQLVITNKKFLPYHVLLPTNESFECLQVSNVPYFIEGTCPNGLSVMLECPVNAKGKHVLLCPGVQTVPKCTVWNDTATSFELTDSCHVTSFDSDKTTCACSVATSDTVVNGRYSVDYVVETTPSFSQTFIEYPPLEESEPTYVVFSVVVAVVAIFVAGLFALGWRDRSDLQSKKYMVSILQRKKLFLTTANFYAKNNYRRTMAYFLESIFPHELRSGPWHVHFKRQMIQQHTVLRLFWPANHQLIMSTVANESGGSGGCRAGAAAGLQTVRWTVFIGRLLALLFVTSLLAFVLYPDDGSCENYGSEGSCNSKRGYFGLYKQCEWIRSNQSCVFEAPHFDFAPIMLLSFLTIVLTIPLWKLVQWLATELSIYALTPSSKSVSPIVPLKGGWGSVRDGSFSYKTDELVDFERSLKRLKRKRQLFFRAARLEKAVCTIDGVVAGQETHVVGNRAQEELYQSIKHLTFTSNKAAINTPNFRLVRFGFDRINQAHLSVRVNQSRVLAEQLHEQMSRLANHPEDQEVLLMKYFLTYCFTGGHRAVVHQRLFHNTSYIGKERDAKSRFSHLRQHVVYGPVLLLSLSALLVGMAYGSLSIGNHLGSKAISMWTLIFCLSIVVDMCLVESGAIWLNSVVFNSTVSAELRDICEYICLRTRLIQMRTTGIMRDTTAYIQHFNPACRIARSFPELPISRILFAMNDFDVPPSCNSHEGGRVASSRRGSTGTVLEQALGWLRAPGRVLCSTFLSALFSLSPSVFQYVLHIGTLLVLYSVASGLYVLYVFFGLGVCMYVTVGFILLLIGRVIWAHVTWKAHERRQEISFRNDFSQEAAEISGGGIGQRQQPPNQGKFGDEGGFDDLELLEDDPEYTSLAHHKMSPEKDAERKMAIFIRKEERKRKARQMRFKLKSIVEATSTNTANSDSTEAAEKYDTDGSGFVSAKQYKEGRVEYNDGADNESREKDDDPIHQETKATMEAIDKLNEAVQKSMKGRLNSATTTTATTAKGKTSFKGGTSIVVASVELDGSTRLVPWKQAIKPREKKLGSIHAEKVAISSLINDPKYHILQEEKIESKEDLAENIEFQRYVHSERGRLQQEKQQQSLSPSQRNSMVDRHADEASVTSGQNNSATLDRRAQTVILKPIEGPPISFDGSAALASHYSSSSFSSYGATGAAAAAAAGAAVVTSTAARHQLLSSVDQLQPNIGPYHSYYSSRTAGDSGGGGESEGHDNNRSSSPVSYRPYESTAALTLQSSTSAVSDFRYRVRDNVPGSVGDLRESMEYTNSSPLTFGNASKDKSASSNTFYYSQVHGRSVQLLPPIIDETEYIQRQQQQQQQPIVHHYQQQQQQHDDSFSLSNSTIGSQLSAVPGVDQHYHPQLNQFHSASPQRVSAARRRSSRHGPHYSSSSISPIKGSAAADMASVGVAESSVAFSVREDVSQEEQKQQQKQQQQQQSLSGPGGSGGGRGGSARRKQYRVTGKHPSMFNTKQRNESYTAKVVSPPLPLTSPSSLSPPSQTYAPRVSSSQQDYYYQQQQSPQQSQPPPQPTGGFGNSSSASLYSNDSKINGAVHSLSSTSGAGPGVGAVQEQQRVYAGMSARTKIRDQYNTTPAQQQLQQQLQNNASYGGEFAPAASGIVGGVLSWDWDAPQQYASAALPSYMTNSPTIRINREPPDVNPPSPSRGNFAVNKGHK